MTIGDDIFTILGMMPTRDRAGIARGTMADDAVKAAGGNAEGQSLMQQGMRPPPPLQLPPMGGPQGDVQLPDDVPTAYAAGRAQPSRAKAPIDQPIPLPAPTERTIASSPAANPSPEVARGSDMILAELQRRKREEAMNGLFASIGLVASSLRGGGGDGGSRNALIEQAFGGGKQPSVSELIALQNLRGQEDTAAATAVAKKNAVDQAMRMFGLSRQDAEARWDTKQLEKLLDPANIKIREEDQRAARTRMDLSKPEVIAELVKLTGQPEALVRAGIASGEITPKKLADLRETQAQTAEREQKTKITKADFGVREEAMTKPEAIAARLSARLGREVTPDEVQLNAATEANWQHWIKEVTVGGQADIAAKDAETASKLATAKKTREDSARALAEEGHRTAVAKNPENFVGLYRGITPDQLREYAKSEAGWKEFQKGQAPGLTPKQQEYWTTYVPQEQAESRTPKSFEVWAKEQARAGGPSPDDLSKTKAVDDVMKVAAAKHTEANQIKTNLKNRQIIQDAWTDKIISGGYGVDKQLMLRSTAARMLGKPDADVDNTQAFFGIMNTEIAAAARLLPGPLSEKELQFIKDMKGGKELTPEGIRTLHLLLDKADHMKLDTYNEWREEEEKHPARGKLAGQEFYGKVEPPPPGRFIREQIEDSPEAVARLRANPTPEEKQKFNRSFGVSTAADWALARPEKRP